MQTSFCFMELSWVRYLNWVSYSVMNWVSYSTMMCVRYIISKWSHTNRCSCETILIQCIWQESRILYPSPPSHVHVPHTLANTLKSFGLLPGWPDPVSHLFRSVLRLPFLSSERLVHTPDHTQTGSRYMWSGTFYQYTTHPFPDLVICLSKDISLETLQVTCDVCSVSQDHKNYEGVRPVHPFLQLHVLQNQLW